MKQFLKISNKGIDGICTEGKNGFKGVFVNRCWMPSQRTVTFEYNAGGSQSCKIDTQEIIDTIMRLCLDERQKKVLLKNVAFIQSESERIYGIAEKGQIVEEGIIKLGEIITLLKKQTNLSADEVITHTMKVKDASDKISELYDEIEEITSSEFEDISEYDIELTEKTLFNERKSLKILKNSFIE